MEHAKVFSHRTVLMTIAWLTVSLCGFTPSALAQYVFNRADFPIAGIGGSCVAVADFNGDGIPDLAVVVGVWEGQGTLSIYLGKPDGTFEPHTDYALGYSPGQALLGDFNGDGKLDIAVLNAGGYYGGPYGYNSYVSVLLGNGDGTFRQQVTSSFGGSVAAPFSFAAGDFNGDGKLDLMTNLPGNELVLILGNGDGTFGTPITEQITTNPAAQISYLAVADFNGDGKLDVALGMEPQTFGDTPFVAILLGNGNSTFQSPVDYTMRGYQQLVAVDVNHDGITDLIGLGADDLYNPIIGVLLGKGDGTFQPEIDSPSVASSWSIVGDLNGDGNLDVAMVTDYPGGQGWRLFAAFGDGKGNFHLSGLNTALPYDAAVGALGDFNGDGVVDLAVARTYGLSILLGNGDGSFGPTQLLSADLPPVSAAVADFNGEGKLDLAIGERYQSSYEIDTWLGKGDGTFSEALPATALTGQPVVAVTADFNRDGKEDIAELLADPCFCIQILLGNGDGTFRTGAKLSAKENDNTIVAGDFNGDGKVDLLLGGISSSARLFLGNGDGTFQSPVGSINWLAYQLSNNLVVGDFNLDGKLDVAAAGLSGYNFVLQVFLGNGDGTFQPPASYAADFDAAGVVSADFNGDGKPDLAVATGFGIDVFLGNGDGTFQPSVLVPNGYGENVQWILAGDFNGDGKIDLVAADQQDGIVDVNLGNGDGTFSVPLDFSVQPGLSAQASGDFNRDGTTDLAFGPSSISALEIWNSAPLAALRPRSLNFGDVPVGLSSAPQTVSLWNIGTAPLELNSIAASGEFSQVNNCGESLPVRGQCSISVTFTPTGGGASNSSLFIMDNAVVHELAVALTGTGAVVPVASVSPESLAFPAQSIGASSMHGMTLSNKGAAALTISGIAGSPGFSQTNNCGSSLAAGSSCTISATFTPTAIGPQKGTITISDNAPGSPQTIIVTGEGAAAALSPGSINFGDQKQGTESPPAMVTLSNSSGSMIHIWQIAIGGANAGDFSKTTTCGSTLGALGNCTISVTFRPSGTSAESATLLVSNDGGGSPQAVVLSGTGTASVTVPPRPWNKLIVPGVGAAASLSPSRLGFASQAVGTSSRPQSLTLSSTSAAAMNIRQIEITGADAADFSMTTTCGDTLAAAGTCTISVTFTPSAEGPRNASLVVKTDGGESPQAVPLSGRGSVSPSFESNKQE